MKTKSKTKDDAQTGAVGAIRRVTVDGEAGWFFPDSSRGATPPQSLCEDCGYLAAAERNYRALCLIVNRKFGGISGVTCGTNGYDEKIDAEYRRRVRLEAKDKRRRLLALHGVLPRGF